MRTRATAAVLLCALAGGIAVLACSAASSGVLTRYVDSRLTIYTNGPILLPECGPRAAIQYEDDWIRPPILLSASCFAYFAEQRVVILPPTRIIDPICFGDWYILNGACEPGPPPDWTSS